MMWIGILSCIALSMLFSGLESAILSVSLVRIRYRAKERDSAARRLLDLFEHRERLLSSILLLNTLTNLLAFAAVTTMMVSWFGAWGYAIAFAIALPIYLLWIELLPKSLFKLYPYRLLVAFLPLLTAAKYAALPVVWLGAMLVSLVRAGEEEAPSPEMNASQQRKEFRVIAAITEKQGELGVTEAEMIRSVLDFRHCKVEDVMLQVSNVTALPSDMSLRQAVAIARRTDFSHFPVMDDSGKLIGLLNIYEALREGRLNGPVYSLIRMLVRLSTEDSGTAAIRSLHAAGARIAAVYNPDQRLVGIVTLHDLVNQLVNCTPSR